MEVKGKLWGEVFPSVKLNKELSVLFNTVIVSKVTLNNQGDLLKVCLYSDHIIP